MMSFPGAVLSLVNRWGFDPSVARGPAPPRTPVDGSEVAEVLDFGSNPGNLRMLELVPANLPPGSPLVVVLHGCLQTARAYAEQTGWSDLAVQHGFALLLPEQRRTNNYNRCFTWFERDDIKRGRGEALSIRQMIARALHDHALDPGRVYVTGLSAGGAMACVMLATYPDVFAGGAVLAGLPYRCANGARQALAVMAMPRVRSERVWGLLVRFAAPRPPKWPAVSIWHGSNDNVTAPGNAGELVKQWRNVHGLPESGAVHDTLDGASRRLWRDKTGRIAVESITVRGMGHGAPIDARGASGPALGRPARFVLDVGISAARHCAQLWRLGEPSGGLAPSAPTADGTADREPEPPGRGLTLLDRLRRAAGGLPGAIAGWIRPAARQQSLSLADEAGWTLRGWTSARVEGDAGSQDREFSARATSGAGYLGGRQTCRMSRSVAIEPGRRLTYERKLDLHAAVTVFTTAGFSLSVDGVEMDRLVLAFANRTDEDWVPKSVDLSPFAGRTVEIVFEVTAASNVWVEVYARASLRRLAFTAPPPDNVST
jgi:poly(hydroxyalkanoate) depolymerase family esterase